MSKEGLRANSLSLNAVLCRYADDQFLSPFSSVRFFTGVAQNGISGPSFKEIPQLLMARASATQNMATPKLLTAVLVPKIVVIYIFHTLASTLSVVHDAHVFTFDVAMYSSS